LPALIANRDEFDLIQQLAPEGQFIYLSVRITAQQCGPTLTSRGCRDPRRDGLWHHSSNSQARGDDLDYPKTHHAAGATISRPHSLTTLHPTSWPSFALAKP
jgi:hypothetical protein